MKEVLRINIPLSFWRVKEEGIHLCRLIYLNDEEFNLLKVLRSCFLRRARRFFKKGPKQQFYPRKQALTCPVTQDDHKSNGKIYPSYEATNIQDTRKSLFWSWRRVIEYSRDLLDMDNKSAMKQAHILMRS